MTTDIAATPEQLKRLADTWQSIAREEVTVEQVKGVFYAWLSELGALRLFYVYNKVNRNHRLWIGERPAGRWFVALDPDAR